MEDKRRRQWHPTPVLLPGKSHGWRSLVGCSPWGHQESDTTERLHLHFSLSCIREGNGNPLQSSCLENPRDRGAWWAAVYGVAQSRTRLKWLSGSSSRGQKPKVVGSPAINISPWLDASQELLCLNGFSPKGGTEFHREFASKELRKGRAFIYICVNESSVWSFFTFKFLSNEKRLDHAI